MFLNFQTVLFSVRNVGVVNVNARLCRKARLAFFNFFACETFVTF